MKEREGGKREKMEEKRKRNKRKESGKDRTRKTERIKKGKTD